MLPTFGPEDQPTLPRHRVQPSMGLCPVGNSRSYAGSFLARGTEITLFERAPILRNVVLHNVRDEAKRFAVPSVAGLFRIPWNQIEQYEGYGFPAHTMVSLLRVTPALAKFFFKMERGDQRIKDRLGGDLEGSKATNQCLTHFKLDATALSRKDTVDIAEFLSLLNFPSLRFVDIAVKDHPECSFHDVASLIIRSEAEKKVEGIRFVGSVGSPPNRTSFLPVLHEFASLTRLHLEMDHEIFLLFEMLSGGFLPSLQQLFVDWNQEYGVWQDARENVLETFRDTRLVSKPKLATLRPCKTIEYLQIRVWDSIRDLEHLNWLVACLDSVPDPSQFDLFKVMRHGLALLLDAGTIVNTLEGTDGTALVDRRIICRMNKIKKFYDEESHLRNQPSFILHVQSMFFGAIRINLSTTRPKRRSPVSGNLKSSSVEDSPGRPGNPYGRNWKSSPRTMDKPLASCSPGPPLVLSRLKASFGVRDREEAIL